MNSEEYTSEIEVLLYLAIELLGVFDEDESKAFMNKHIEIANRYKN